MRVGEALVAFVLGTHFTAQSALFWPKASSENYSKGSNLTLKIAFLARFFCETHSSGYTRTCKIGTLCFNSVVYFAFSVHLRNMENAFLI